MSGQALPLVSYAVRLRVPAWGGRGAVVLDEDRWHVRGLELDEGLLAALEQGDYFPHDGHFAASGGEVAATRVLDILRRRGR